LAIFQAEVLIFRQSPACTPAVRQAPLLGDDPLETQLIVGFQQLLAVVEDHYEE
jgi:hypothetical protein